MAKQKLELTWIGKNIKPKLEPRILIEDPEKSYGSSGTENKLIHGDNLLALKALEQDYAGKIKCVYIDPPYNTGNAFEHYDDGLEHSIWLSLMRDRLEILWKLLSEDGSIWINIDYKEVHYLKVLCDELFGRNKFLNEIIWQKRTSRENRKAIGSAHDTILLYTKSDHTIWKHTRNLLSPKSNSLANPDNDPKGRWSSIPFSAQGFRKNQMYDIETPTGITHQPPKGRCWGATEVVYKKLRDEGRVYYPSSGNGKPRIKQYEDEQKGLVPMTVWLAEDVGTTEESKKEVMNIFTDSEAFDTPKPERLIKQIIHIATNPGDFVLDSFLGSGTTAAVSHKMGRKWIGIELGEHCSTHCKPRMDKVISGEDQGGVSKTPKAKAKVVLCKECNDLICDTCSEKIGKNDKGGEILWKGGGGYKYYELAPSLLNKDSYGNWIINKKYNADMMAAAMAKQEGFKYNPDPDIYWKQGQSTEQDYIFTTTEFLTQEHLEHLHGQMRGGESLLICCKAFNANDSQYSNMTIKKIPQMLMGKCEFGKDDYSLNIINIPTEDENGEDFSFSEPTPEYITDRKSKPKPKYIAGQIDLFDVEVSNE